MIIHTTKKFYGGLFMKKIVLFFMFLIFTSVFTNVVTAANKITEKPDYKIRWGMGTVLFISTFQIH
ncbi:hypothetical protein DFR58_10898 [Anaerobacterium chartisolvens]|uniref:Uncharacterized protein n=1 Tax=Anaerobacterium chartisolvens TaxID=1297424 RepID=A0A369BC21_9FIRM|nr:hypothetical protein DFR58_10898 [Anaerobacterium chartisolvens]